MYNIPMRIHIDASTLLYYDKIVDRLLEINKSNNNLLTFFLLYVFIVRYLNHAIYS